MAVGKPLSQGIPEEAQERLLIEAAQHDPSRFAELYENNFERVYAYVRRHVRDRGQAEDLTSVVFHKALENLKRFKWTGAPFAAWLFRIAANTIADQARRSARETDISELEDLRENETSQVNLEEVEQSAFLFRLVRELSADQRRVILMRFAEEKSIREIATLMERSEGAVKQLQFRGLEILRAKLGARAGEQNG